MSDHISILHVDDEPAFTELVATFLEREDDRFEVHQVTDPNGCLDRVDELDIDCIVSDYDMPEMNGIDLLETVRDERPDLPFILYTGKGSEEVASEAISAGVSDYLQKGISNDQYTLLANRIRNAVEQVRANQRANELQRINSVVREINAAMARATTTEEIDTRVCEIISEAPHYHSAWIGCLDEATSEIVPRASAGIEQDYLSTIEVTTDDAETGQGPTGQAVRTQELQVVQNIPEDPTYEPWREAALERGYRSSAAVPLVHEGTFHGVLTVYAAQTHAFNEAEQQLLSNLGESIAHAHHRVNLQRESVEQYRTLFEEAPIMVIFTRAAADEPIIDDCNREFADRLGYAREDVIGSPITRFYTDDSQAALLDDGGYDRALAGEFLREQRTLVTDDGDEILTILRAGPRRDESGEIIGTHAMFLDITNEQQVTDLQQSNAVLSSLIDSLPQGVIVADADGTIISLNPRLFDLLGMDMSPEDFLGADSSSLVQEMAQQITESQAFVDSVDRIEGAQVAREYDTFELSDGKTIERRYRQLELPSGSGHLWVYNDVSEILEFTETIEELHYRTRELILLQDREEICKKAVAIAAETLDFSLSGIHLVDDAYERLVPVAVTEAVIEHVGEAPTYERHNPSRSVDTYNWEVFETGEPLVVTDTDADSDFDGSDTPAQSGIVYPLGAHGIFITSSPEANAFDERDVTLVELFSTILTAVLDRTEREADLRSTEAFLRESLDVLADVFIVLGDDLDILRWNDRLEEVTGYDSEEIQAMTPDEFFYEEHRGRIAKAANRVVDTGSGQVELDLLTKDGERIPYEFRGSRLPHPDGSGFAIAGAGRDISEREQYESMIANLHEVAAELNECHSREAIFAKTIEAASNLLEFDQASIAVRVDDHLEAVAMSDEMPLDELPTMGLEEGIAGRTYQTKQSFLIGDATTDEDAVPQSDEIKGAMSVPIGDSGLIQVVDDEPDAFDQRDLKLVELLVRHTELALKRLEREQEIEERNDRLEQFVSVVSHDLRNPLNVAEGRLELARETGEAAHLDAIESAHDRMQVLIEDLLDLARQGESVSETTTLELSDVANASWANVQSTDATLDIDSTGSVVADETRLKQLFENLFRNAIEHGGESVSVHVGTLEDGFYVEDDGPGISAEERETIFDLGYSTGDGGSGFGLSIVSEIVEAHDWDIEVTEGAAGGARFEITSVQVDG